MPATPSRQAPCSNSVANLDKIREIIHWQNKEKGALKESYQKLQYGKSAPSDLFWFTVLLPHIIPSPGKNLRGRRAWRTTSGKAVVCGGAHGISGLRSCLAESPFRRLISWAQAKHPVRFAPKTPKNYYKTHHYSLKCTNFAAILVTTCPDGRPQYTALFPDTDTKPKHCIIYIHFI